MAERRAFTDEDLARLNLAPLVYPDSRGPPRDRASTLRRHAHAAQERVNALNKLRQVVSAPWRTQGSADDPAPVANLALTGRRTVASRSHPGTVFSAMAGAF